MHDVAAENYSIPNVRAELREKPHRSELRTGHQIRNEMENPPGRAHVCNYLVHKPE